MSALFQRFESHVFVEFGDGAAHIASSDRALELPVEMLADGTLAAGSIESIRNAIGLVARRESSQVFCLLPARGVSLRKISLPANSRADVERLLPLQIDAQFPLSSSELSWGYAELPGGGVMRDFLVAAIKREALEAYRAVIAGAGFDPVFCVAALARRGLLPHAARGFGLLEAGRTRSELLLAEADGSFALRALLWGADSSESIAPLLAGVSKLYVSGREAAAIVGHMEPSLKAEVLPGSISPTSAIAGLRELLRRRERPLVIEADRQSVSAAREPAQWRWAAAAALLALVSLGLYYAEPILRRKKLAGRVEELAAYQKKLPDLEREVSFLQYIKTNQPSYLDALAAIAAANSQGTKMDALAITRRGDVSFRGQAQNAQTPTSIRSKLIESGYFSVVTVDEQTPAGQNQQQVNFRLTAVLRPENERPAAAKTSEAATNKPPEKPVAPAGGPAVAAPNPPPQQASPPG